MSANTVWDSPATLVLLAVVAANLILPVAHFWPETGHGGVPARASNEDAAAPPGPVAARPDGAAAMARSPAAEGPSSADAPAPRLAPVITPELAKRVSLRKPAPVCHAWGPFTTLEEAEQLARRLGLPGRDFEVFESEVAADPDYLVTVRASGSRDAAERVLEELGSRGVDSYLLERAGAASVLAAGVFSAAARADAQQSRLAELGYDAAVQPLQRAHQVYHLLARLPASADPEVTPLGACGDIAPLEQFL